MTVSEIIDRLGGHAAVAEALGITQSSSRNYSERNAFPPWTYPKLMRFAKKKSVKIPDALFSFAKKKQVG